uniref:Peptidase C14 caspase domain-containing protein n=1 Tax=Amphora coffeiformis TaxID=265554 RepID=A0A7S3P5R9_9STRA
MGGDFEGKAHELIPADVRMISGCQDAQTSADVGNVATFSLPDPAGRAGGACTSALLKVLYQQNGTESFSFVDVLMRMRTVLRSGSYPQIPQLSCSRKMDVQEKFTLVPESSSTPYGSKRALLIGINYVGQQGELRGCHNDVGNIKRYIMDVHGFQEEDIVVLMDDGNHELPTYDNIIAAFRRLVNDTESGDCAFFHYSGHGGRLPDDNGDEEDGYDETLIPVDYQSAGQIRDDLLYSDLVGRMPEGSTLTCLMDCCHSGSVLDLPYTFQADGEQQEMGENPKANMGRLQAMAVGFLVRKIFGTGPAAQMVMSLATSGLAMAQSGGSSGGQKTGGANNVLLPLLEKVASVVCN